MITRSQRKNMNDINQPAAAAALNDSLPGPGTFNGRSNGAEWLKRFELWAQCRQLTNDIKLAAIQLHLVDAAATWADVLAADEKDTWPHFRTAFVTRYGPNNQSAWQRFGQLWTVRQNTDERALDFIARVQQLARSADVPVAMQISAIINGLQPAIRSYILRQNPVDLAALRQAAVAAEHHEQFAGDNTSDAIQRIEQRLDQLTMHAISAVDRQQRRRSPSVESDNISRQSPRQYLDRRNRQPRRSQSPLPRPHRQSSISPSDRRVTFDPAIDDRQRRPDRGTYPPCDNCGRRNHRRRDCYFRWSQCATCHRVGHTQSVCRSAVH
jgi:hypothetical protein